MKHFPTTLDESQALWPHPEAESKRFELRKWILQHAPKHGIGAEIGTFRGHFSVALVRRLQPKRLYLIDPWTQAGEETDGQVPGGPVLPTAAARLEAEWRLRPYVNCEVRFIEGAFPACKDEITDRLDFAYLGAGCDFDTTRQQLRVVDKLLAPRGIVMGDDWDPDPESPRHGVFRAVNIYAKNNGYDIVAAGPFGQWAIRRRADWRPATRAEGEGEGQEAASADAGVTVIEG